MNQHQETLWFYLARIKLLSYSQVLCFAIMNHALMHTFLMGPGLGSNGCLCIEIHIYLLIIIKWNFVFVCVLCTVAFIKPGLLDLWRMACHQTSPNPHPLPPVPSLSHGSTPTDPLRIADGGRCDVSMKPQEERN